MGLESGGEDGSVTVSWSRRLRGLMPRLTYLNAVIILGWSW